MQIIQGKTPQRRFLVTGALPGPGISRPEEWREGVEQRSQDQPRGQAIQANHPDQRGKEFQVFGFRFPVFGGIHSSSPDAERGDAVIISGFWVRFPAERDKKSVKNFEQIAIYLKLLEFNQLATAVVTAPSAGKPVLGRGCAAGVPLTGAGVSPVGTWLAGRFVF
jgi:hypothetical protein